VRNASGPAAVNGSTAMPARERATTMVRVC
jgi:hypothetical protein